MNALTLNLRPATFKMLLLAAGVLLGLLAVTLLFGAQAHTAHGVLVDSATKVHFAAKLKPFGVLWH